MTLGPDVAILCHHDPEGRLRPDTVRYIDELRTAGFSVVVVSNGTPVSSDTMAALDGTVAVFLSRRNAGLDFGAWRTALRTLGLPRPNTQRILLVNDSVYGPFVPLAPVLARMPAAEADLWGLTDSRERGWHLQSYFLLAHAGLFRDAVWPRFWRGVVPLPFKRWVVGRYEIGLSRRVAQAGLRARAAFPYATVVPDGSIPNPTLGAWRALLDAGFPFLKRELLRDNPTGVVGLDAWRGLVAPALVKDIDEDLRRSAHRPLGARSGSQTSVQPTTDGRSVNRT